MKIWVLVLLVTMSLCDDIHYFHYGGSMSVNNDNGVIFGRYMFEPKNPHNMTYIAGMYVKNGVHTPFEFAAQATSFVKKEDGSFIITATCVEGRWAQKAIPKLHGTAMITGTWEKAIYNCSCQDATGATKYTAVANGEKSPCAFYNMTEAATRAQYLVGLKSDDYGPAHVLNHAVYGYPYITAYNCKYYHDSFGKITKDAKAGVVIVGNDSAHCAIIDKEGDKFIQSNPVKKEVTINPLTMLKDYFKKGYVYKEYKCATYAPY